jgi:uncharacterized membrane protein YedE/YeeE
MKPAALLSVLVSGALFGFGLALSTMIKPEVVLSFLRLHDMGLLLVLGGAVAVTFVAYRFAPRVLSKPLAGERFGVHPSEMGARTLGGAALFGIGWGLSGVCPGPAIAGLGVGNWPILAALAAMVAGAYVQGRFFGVLKPLGVAVVLDARRVAGFLQAHAELDQVHYDLRVTLRLHTATRLNSGKHCVVAKRF